MRLEAEKLLFDTATAARLILQFTTGKNFEQYMADPLLQSAVERQFTIIGEAMSRLPKFEPAVPEQIPEYRAAVGFRNLLVHGYTQIDHRIVWSTVQDHLPSLLERIEKMLAGS
jgi:uncharacterized protein with HEPN domain